MTGRAEFSTRAAMRVVVMVLASALTCYLVWRLRQPLGWLAAAAFIAVAAAPPVNRLSRRMPRGLAITVVYLVLVLVPVGLGALIVPPMVGQGTALVRDMPTYARQIEEFVARSKRLQSLDDKFDITGTLQREAQKAPARIGDAAKVLTDIGLWIVSSLFAAVNVLILSVFLLAGGGRWADGFVNLRPPPERERLRRVLDSTARAISGYVQGALLIGAIAAVCTFLVLTILGVPFAAPLSVLAGFASLIPLVGATVAAVVIGIVTLFTDFPTATIVWAVWAVVYQQIENNLIQPQVQKRTVHVQPIVVLVAVLFGATLLGIAGAIVAIPFAASIQIMIGEWWDWRREQRADPLPDPDGEESPPGAPAAAPAGSPG